MTAPDVAVVITCFNLGRTLEEAIESVKAQTVPAAELIVVDDGSTDLYTRQLLERLAGSGLNVVRTSHRGVCAARNTGIGLVAADAIVLLDADDALAPTYIEVAADRLRTNSEIAFVSTGMQSIGDSNEVWVPPAPDFFRALSGEVVHVSSIFRRTLWEAVGGFDEQLPAHEEVDFWARALALGFRGDVVPEPLLLYRVRPGSLYRTAVRADVHTALFERIYKKHEGLLANQIEPLLLAKERFLLGQRRHRRHLLDEVKQLQREVDLVDQAVFDARNGLAASGLAEVNFGDLRRVRPISPVWGLDRGMPLDRYYVQQFLERHRSDIHGRVLEVKDDGYAKLFGGDRVLTADVIDINSNNPRATMIADLVDTERLPADTYDCVILTQMLSLVFDVAAVLESVHRMLKPGGILVCTVPAAGRITCEDQQLDGDYWRFTEASLRRLFGSVFPLAKFAITAFGNVLSCASFLYGLAPDELTAKELDTFDPFFPLVFGIRAQKPESGVAGVVKGSAS